MGLEPLPNGDGSKPAVNSGYQGLGQVGTPTVGPLSPPKVQNPVAPNVVSPSANTEAIDRFGAQFEKLHSGIRGANVASEAYFPPPDLARFRAEAAAIAATPSQRLKSAEIGTSRSNAGSVMVLKV